MKKTTLATFDTTEVFNNGHFIVKTEEYLKQLAINNIIVLPLRKIEGNIESKAAKDSVIIILSGSGSMEVNGSSVQITSGDVIYIKADEKFGITNDSLDAALQFVSVLKK
jgi:mannose-6-phosphate isomerase-like protein (cupin superfamily)